MAVILSPSSPAHQDKHPQPYEPQDHDPFQEDENDIALIQKQKMRQCSSGTDQKSLKSRRSSSRSKSQRRAGTGGRSNSFRKSAPSVAFFQSLGTIPEENTVAFVRDPLMEAPDLDEETVRLMNEARFYQTLPPLQRAADLDLLARLHALKMALEQSVHHSVTSVQQLQNALQSKNVGENIHRGKNVLDMHTEIMKCDNPHNSINRANLFSSKFNQMGSGTVLGEDGLLYSVQLFRKSKLTSQ
mmetsp:Transcript_40249/g.83832  ORF Transcript_40249/g.83832 Transcript_40249/m.83832 type:complete len:243 (-) Transcript_40249:134-862(-)|eukprot:CAMPEP_0172457910 /NCGR_PEP_ID=MMETSP1065-20121228/24988_1 /TAXON_ID=265537 /ORGANISM="Amphiprora paludosa, Strain CCMP125" /LENGTH=242 /DNA_ID=CAMNT_0013211899 /DNA_START=311 /DNA_END=1039 /DNA_ORIENTATION=+